MIWIMFACSMSAPSTLVDELRVMAIQTEPAEVSPMDPDAKLRLLISDPLAQGADIVYWTCTNFGDGCLEAEFYADSLSQWPQTFSREGLLTERSFSLPPAMAGVIATLPEDTIPFRGSILWVLACKPNECSFINDIQQDIIDTELMSAPTSILEDVPFGMASLSFISIPISNRSFEERIQNPELSPLFDEIPMQAPEETLELSFSYDLKAEANEDSLVYGYATLGGFPETDRTNAQLQEQSGTFLLPWIAPQETGEGEIYIVLENGLGGTGIWFSEAEVRD